MDIEKAKIEFENYVKKFDIENLSIKNKRSHSYRVMENSREIAESLNLNEREKNVAILIGLLHDIGRFVQMTEYNTFNDFTSIDHGDVGVEILEKDNYIRKFIEEDDYDYIIKTAIKNHNKYKIEDGLDEKTKLFCQIICDADKLDIIYESTCIFWNLPENIERMENSEITENFFEQFLNKKLVERKTTKILPADSIISTCAFIYDLNFAYSYKRIFNDKWINKIFERFDFKVENTRKKLEIVQKIANEDLKNKITD